MKIIEINKPITSEELFVLFLDKWMIKKDRLKEKPMLKTKRCYIGDPLMTNLFSPDVYRKIQTSNSLAQSIECSKTNSRKRIFR